MTEIFRPRREAGEGKGYARRRVSERNRRLRRLLARRWELGSARESHAPKVQMPFPQKWLRYWKRLAVLPSDKRKRQELSFLPY